MPQAEPGPKWEAESTGGIIVTRPRRAALRRRRWVLGGLLVFLLVAFLSFMFFFLSEGPARGAGQTFSAEAIRTNLDESFGLSEETFWGVVGVLAAVTVALALASSTASRNLAHAFETWRPGQRASQTLRVEYAHTARLLTLQVLFVLLLVLTAAFAAVLGKLFGMILLVLIAAFISIESFKSITTFDRDPGVFLNERIALLRWRAARIRETPDDRAVIVALFAGVSMLVAAVLGFAFLSTPDPLWRGTIATVAVSTVFPTFGIAGVPTAVSPSRLVELAGWVLLGTFWAMFTLLCLLSGFLAAIATGFHPTGLAVFAAATLASVVMSLAWAGAFGLGPLRGLAHGSLRELDTAGARLKQQQRMPEHRAALKQATAGRNSR